MKALQKIREKNPVIHHITNFVAMDLTANGLLALGASPVMAHAPEEVAEMTALSQALVINIGTLNRDWVESMRIALAQARERKIATIFDPVGAGATRYRTQTAQALFEEFHPSVIRGNASEILAVAQLLGQGGCAQLGAITRGVESSLESHHALAAAQELARKGRGVVCVSGAVDWITDGTRIARVHNGHEWMTRVTGMGCLATSLIGAFCAVDEDHFTATISAMAVMGVCGELAAAESSGPGGFRAHFVDRLFTLRESVWVGMARVEVEGASLFESKAP